MSTNTLVQNQNAEPTRAGRTYLPRVDIFETDQELLLCADLPGVAPDAVDLRYERGELTLWGKRSQSPAPGQPLLAEFDAGDFHRVFQVHESIDASKIEAEHKNGVLTVHLPKQEAVKPRFVTVKN